MAIGVDEIKKLREETQAPVMEIKKALEETGGDGKKARDILRKKALVRAGEKKGREAGTGAVFSYIHGGGKVGVLLELKCETDFVARNDLFQKLGKELVMQVAAMDPKDIKELLGQDYVRDPSKKVSALVDETSGTLGEKIEVGKFTRYAL
jgi:elongation factor Ts